MRLVNSLADLMLGLVAPKATAGACIPPDPWLQSCGCKSHSIWVKNCSYNCAGKAICGSCHNDYIGC